jgi:SAM-dependent methyltransferase
VPTAESYDSYYGKPNYFGYREWLHAPYISSLIGAAGLRAGSSVLDVGCGQGFFSSLLRRCGLDVYALDLSETGLRVAKHAYAGQDIHFLAADAMSPPFSHQFDAVFTRSFSLYNREDFPADTSVTDSLLRLVKPNGRFIFLYSTNLHPDKTSASWRFHSLDDVRKHFSRYPNRTILFISKLDTLFLRRHAFSRLSSTLNAFLSTELGLGGDIVCIVRKG